MFMHGCGCVPQSFIQRGGGQDSVHRPGMRIPVLDVEATEIKGAKTWLSRSSKSRGNLLANKTWFLKKKWAQNGRFFWILLLNQVPLVLSMKHVFFLDLDTYCSTSHHIILMTTEVTKHPSSTAVSGGAPEGSGLSSPVMPAATNSDCDVLRWPPASTHLLVMWVPGHSPTMQICMNPLLKPFPGSLALMVLLDSQWWTHTHTQTDTCYLAFASKCQYN